LLDFSSIHAYVEGRHDRKLRWFLSISSDESSLEVNECKLNLKNDEKRENSYATKFFLRNSRNFWSIHTYVRKGVTKTNACVTKVFLRFSRNFWSILCTCTPFRAPSLVDALMCAFPRTLTCRCALVYLCVVFCLGNNKCPHNTILHLS